ncbi:MAG: hypothetical protein IPF52_15965 [Saprospiraceae bacterium]|nr:hypothetical protein [Saprospiraceae bacterium]
MNMPGSTDVTQAISITNGGAINETAQTGANCVYGSVSDVQGPCDPVTLLKWLLREYNQALPTMASWS